uniref:TLC domain-containing protein n=1 Tax=viral metagenome TaxID=1070528 RepID=A0A6C0BAF1_9ZZZZ
MERKITLLSSFIFLTNSFIAAHFNYMLYSVLFFILFLTSILFRLNKNIFTYTLDKLFVYAIILYGGYMFYMKYPSIHTLISFLIISTFFSVVFIYEYGYLTKQYCFDNDSVLSETYHALLHIISSIGHSLIMIS